MNISGHLLRNAEWLVGRLSRDLGIDLSMLQSDTLAVMSVAPELPIEGPQSLRSAPCAN